MTAKLLSKRRVNVNLYPFLPSAITVPRWAQATASVFEIDVCTLESNTDRRLWMI